MELEGLKRSVEFLKENNLHIQTVITDRHRMIGKWLRENVPGVKHLFDVWHVSAGMCM